MSKKYNTTDLSPDKAFERHIYHRDQFAHYLRWTKVLKDIKPNKDLSVLDFGCGQGNLAEVLYRNRHKPSEYLGFDIRSKTIEGAKDKFSKVEWADFDTKDLVQDDFIDYLGAEFDIICSFEVIEHIGKQNADKFLQNMSKFGHAETKYYISTPCFDEQVGAAGNHTFDSGDGRGVAPQEFSLEEMEDIFSRNGFTIVRKYGTFASIKDYKPHLSEAQKEMFDALSEYYDANLVSVMFAPLFPNHSCNCLWILEHTGEVDQQPEEDFWS